MLILTRRRRAVSCEPRAAISSVSAETNTRPSQSTVQTAARGSPAGKTNAVTDTHLPALVPRAPKCQRHHESGAKACRLARSSSGQVRTESIASVRLTNTVDSAAAAANVARGLHASIRSNTSRVDRSVLYHPALAQSTPSRSFWAKRKLLVTVISYVQEFSDPDIKQGSCPTSPA